MRHAISFSMCLRDVHRGLLHPDQIDVFWFGCAAEHVVRQDGKVPFEASWLNAVRPHLHEGEGETSAVSVETIDAEALATWQRLLARVTKLDEGGWVNWQAKVPGTGETNYWAIAHFLLGRGDQVWLQGRWLQPADVKHVTPAY